MLPIGIGIVVGVLLGFIAVKQLLALLPFAIVCLFAGLMSGAFPAVKGELKGAERTPLRIALFCVGLLVPVALGALSATLSVRDNAMGADVFANVQWHHVLLAIAVGAAVGLTQIVPGLSARALMMAIGWFNSLVSSISFTYWQTNPQVFFVYAGFAIGFLTGILGFSKLLTLVFARVRQTAYSMIVGLSFGSILSMFCNGDVIAVYLSWAQNGASILDIVLGVILFAVGVFGAYMLVKYERKKEMKKEE